MRFRWHSFGAVRGGLYKSGILLCGSVRFPGIGNRTVRFGAVIHPTVRFGANFRNRKRYGAVRLYFMSYAVQFRAVFPMS